MGSSEARTDGELLAAYSGGGPESAAAFEALVARYGGMVHSSCLRVMGERSAAEDAAQAVFLVLARKAGAVRGSLAGFLHGVALNVASCQRRSETTRRVREREAAEMAAAEREAVGRRPETEALWEEVQPLIDEAVGKLPKAQRAAVALRYLAGRSHREMSRELGISEGAAAVHLNRALESMRSFLRKRGVGLSAAALPAMLAAQAGGGAGCPAFLLSAAGKFAAAGLGSGSAALTGNVAALAKGAIQMMFWAKVKVAAAVVGGILVLGGGAMTVNRLAAGEPVAKPEAAAPVKPGEFRKEKDESGKEWTLTEWKEGERPYKKALAEREAEYKKKWGEAWRGAPHKSQGGNYIMSPGVWKWEEFLVIPDARKASPINNNMCQYLSQACAFAPGGGAEVTAVWAMAGFGIFHVDTRTKQVTFAGTFPKFTYKDPNAYKGYPNNVAQFEGPMPEALKDGLDDKARLWIGLGSLVADKVNGRVYFAQGSRFSTEYQGLCSGPRSLRYAEELRPYTVGGKEMLLPAILDHKEMYKKIGAEPVMKDGKRAPARIAIRTTPIKPVPEEFFGFSLSIDGKTAYFAANPTWPRTWNVDYRAVEIDTGKDLGPVPSFAQKIPPGYYRDAHGAFSDGRWDGNLYMAAHPGCAQGPGRLFSVELKTGKVTRLYDSLMAWPELEAGGPGDQASRHKVETGDYPAALRAAGVNDGPADAISLKFVTTCFQSQCPRTGAIIHGGWDAAGLRRYHDGFVTSVAETGQMDANSPRPEWKGQNVACFGSLFIQPDVAPDGSLWLTDSNVADLHFKGNQLRLEGTRIVHMWRTDWPKEQSINGYANQFLPPEKREALMLEYCKNYIANYAELSKIY